MKAVRFILTLSFLMIVTISSAQRSKIDNAQSEIRYKRVVWVADDSARMQAKVHWITNELDLVVSKKLSKILSLNSVPQNGKVSEVMDGKTLVLAQPFLSCGIGHNLFKLITETSDELVFEGFWAHSGEKTGELLTFRRKIE